MSTNPPEPPELPEPQPAPLEPLEPLEPLPAPQPPPPGGTTWLGILLAILLPIVGTVMAVNLANYASFPVVIIGVPIAVTAVLAIVLSSVHSTRRTGIGMLIGIAALPIIFFGVCTATLLSY